MNLKNQVISLELAKKLKELKINEDHQFVWINRIDADWQLWSLINYQNMSHEYGFAKDEIDRIPAYTVAELGEILPNIITLHIGMSTGEFRLKISPTQREGDYYHWWVYYSPENFSTDKIAPHEDHCKLVDAMAKMLIYLKENKLI